MKKNNKSKNKNKVKTAKFRQTRKKTVAPKKNQNTSKKPQKKVDPKAKKKNNSVSKPRTTRQTAKGKNVSQKIKNGTLVITRDDYLYGADGKSTKSRMTTVVDSNKNDELAIVKYTKSKKNGRPFENGKGFKRHGNTIYIADNNGNAIKIDKKKFKLGSPKRAISKRQANEIKRRNIKESKNSNKNIKLLRKLKKRNPKKPKKGK